MTIEPLILFKMRNGLSVRGTLNMVKLKKEITEILYGKKTNKHQILTFVFVLNLMIILVVDIIGLYVPSSDASSLVCPTCVDMKTLFY